MSAVSTGTCLLRSISDFFLNLSFHMFPYNKILKILESKCDLIFEISTQIPLNAKSKLNQSRRLSATSV